jgi:hypothetical protein
LLARLAFALEKAARDFACGVETLFIIYGEWKKVRASLGWAAAVAVARITVSPWRTVTAPFACPASLPVSIVSVESPKGIENE